jgi:hypothetical protein
MFKKDKIHIRIELCKDENSGNITLLTYFDPNAPNLSQDNKGFYWLPTSEEKDFINDVFALFPEFEMKSPSHEKIVSESLEKREEKPIESRPQINMERKEPEPSYSPPTETKEEPRTLYPPQTNMENKESQSTPVEPTENREEPKTLYPPENNMENKESETPISPPPYSDMEKKEPESPPSPFEKQEREYPVDNIPPFQKTEESESGETQQNSDEIKDDSKKDFVEADDQAIDRALEKGEEKEMVEADEDTIVEKVLSQKQKGKWTREQ